MDYFFSRERAFDDSKKGRAQWQQAMDAYELHLTQAENFIKNDLRDLLDYF